MRAAKTRFAKSDLCRRAACQFVFNPVAQVRADRQRLYALSLAAQKLPDVDAVRLQYLGQMFDYGAEELHADGGRYPIRDLQNPTVRLAVAAVGGSLGLGALSASHL